MADEQLSAGLIERLRKRANDPERRSDARSILGQSIRFDSLLDRLGPKGEQLRSIQSQLQGLMGGFGLGGTRVAVPMAEIGGGLMDAPDPLSPPVPEERLAAAEQTLGRPIPAALRQLYGSIADGGFGPGGGLFPLDRMIAEYEEMTGEPAGPQNQPWPANLLPLIDAEPGYDCLDLDSGEVIAWDPEEIEGYSNAAWLRSFKPAAPSLAAWLEDWLERPTVAERMQEQREQSMANAMTSHLKNMLEFYEKNPEKRAEHGLPEVGWEDEVRRRHSPPQ